MRIVAISDTHFPIGIELPEGDVLVHAGDHTMWGMSREVMDRLDFIADLPHRHKIVIAGNHDFALQRDANVINWARSHKGFDYRVHEPFVVEGLKFFASPWVPALPTWAFTYTPQLQPWSNLPMDIEVLITHGPAKGRLDKVADGEHVGCPYLRTVVNSLAMYKLKVHIFGHIHESYGMKEALGVKYVNASHCTYPEYKRINPPIVVDI